MSHLHVHCNMKKLNAKIWCKAHDAANIQREYSVIIRDNFCQFCTKKYVVTPYLNRLDKMVQMKGPNICF